MEAKNSPTRQLFFHLFLSSRTPLSKQDIAKIQPFFLRELSSQTRIALFIVTLLAT